LRWNFVRVSNALRASIHLVPPPSLRQANKGYTIVADGYVDMTSVNRSTIVKTIITMKR